MDVVDFKKLFGIVDDVTYEETKSETSVIDQIKSLNEKVAELTKLVTELKSEKIEKPTQYLSDIQIGKLTDMFKPDPSLAEDEWHVVFSDYRDLSSGIIQKTPWMGGSNMTSTFKVKRIP